LPQAGGIQTTSFFQQPAPFCCVTIGLVGAQTHRDALSLTPGKAPETF
jgi:hypothetical protein